MHQKIGNLYFVAVTKFNVSPAWALSFLGQLARVFKDFCGVLSEESLRLNFALVYEILEEAIVRFPLTIVRALAHHGCRRTLATRR